MEHPTQACDVNKQKTFIKTKYKKFLYFMNIHKKFIDKLLCKRNGVLYYLITDKKMVWVLYQHQKILSDSLIRFFTR